MVAAMSDVRIDSQNLPLDQLRVEGPRRRGGLPGATSRADVDRQTRVVLPDGRRLSVSKRFWSSFSSLYNLSRSVFDYFPHDEVFARIAQTKRDRVRLAFEGYDRVGGDVQGRLLSCTNPTRPLLRVDEANQLLEQLDAGSVTYGEGIATAAFDCPLASDFEVGGDGFKPQVHLQMPLDGYGLPAAYLGLLRLVCTNGMVGMSKAFKTVFHLGKQQPELYPVLERAMASFNHEEGFAALRDRLDSATGSWASLKEAGELQGLVASSITREGMNARQATDVLHRFETCAASRCGYSG